MGKKPQEVRLFGPNEVVLGPLASDDGIVVGSPSWSTMKFDRATVTKKLWEVPSDSLWISERLDGFILGADRDSVKVRRSNDGSLAWEVAGLRYVSCWRDDITIVESREVQFRSPENGEIRRTTPLPWHAEGIARSCGAVVLVQGTDQNRIAAVDAASGRVLWDRGIGAECDALQGDHVEGQQLLAIVHHRNDLIVVKRGGALVRLDPASGSIRWRAPVGLEGYDLTVSEDRAFVPGRHGLTIIDMETGGTLSSREFPKLKPVSRPRPGVVYRNRVAFPYESGHVVVYDQSGVMIAVHTARKRFWSGIEADGRLIAAASGALVVFDESIWGPG